jgi:hypothetical protein
MATIRISDARARATQQVVKAQQYNMSKTASVLLNDAYESQTKSKLYDIFMSHPKKDDETILGVKLLLEDLGHSVYVDWLEDPHLDRSNVSPATAETLRERMGACKSLFYTTTENSSSSKWMPWECGYFDGKKGKAAILPLTADGSAVFKGQEYLGLYPYIMVAPAQGETKKYLWVHSSPDTYVLFVDWLKGGVLSKH